ncbi:MAG: DUF3309 domain-containing protein [Desulfuromonadaceae bacterium]|nr:DUF3309 domain-containing protein [Desulfuromonadaceae bacterium]
MACLATTVICRVQRHAITSFNTNDLDCGPEVQTRPSWGRISRTSSRQKKAWKRGDYMLGTIVIIVVILLLLGALPTWNYSRQWGYFPSGGLSLLLVILILLMLTGRL